MKNCKYCQTEIDEKAKVCPVCHKKQRHIVRWILLGIVIIAIISAALGGKKEDSFQKEYNQSDVVTYKDVAYSITNVEKTKGENQFFQAKEGYEYVKVTIKIENNGDKKISYNPLDFQMVNGDGAEASIYSITAEDDIMLQSGELDSGGTIEGVIIWEQKQGDTGLKVRYYNNVLIDNDYTFEWTLD